MTPGIIKSSQLLLLYCLITKIYTNCQSETVIYRPSTSSVWFSQTFTVKFFTRSVNDFLTWNEIEDTTLIAYFWLLLGIESLLSGYVFFSDHHSSANLVSIESDGEDLWVRDMMDELNSFDENGHYWIGLIKDGAGGVMLPFDIIFPPAGG